MSDGDVVDSTFAAELKNLPESLFLHRYELANIVVRNFQYYIYLNKFPPDVIAEQSCDDRV
jgi:hypothetical protein